MDLKEKLTEFVVFVRRKLGSPKLRKHLSRIFQSISKIVRVLQRIGKWKIGKWIQID
jgi:hypothetical protein